MANVDEITIGESATLKTAMRVIDQTAFGMVFVVDDAKSLQGVATDGDIRRGLLSGYSVNTEIHEIMNTDPLVAQQSWDQSETRERLRQQGLNDKISPSSRTIIPIIDDSEQIVDSIVVNGTGETIDKTISQSNHLDRILVIGGAGYLGSLLSRLLLESGYTVRVLDNLIVGKHGIEELFENDDFEFIEGDMRSIETIVEAIKNVDAVIHLGGLVGDPASAIDPQTTLELNYHSVHMVASVCKYHQINRFVFASTCSVYGRSETPEELLTETSPVNPVSLYAQSNLKAEKAILDLADENFSPTILRMATLYGLSPRMRFDLVVNILSAKAATEGTIPIFGGSQYRPNLHVRDAANAYIECIESPIQTVDSEIFNVGSNEENYQIYEIGELVSECFPDAQIDHQREKEDDRSYQVDFSKIQEQVGYTTEYTISDAAHEIKEGFEAGQFGDYTDSMYSNYDSTEEELGASQ